MYKPNRKVPEVHATRENSDSLPPARPPPSVLLLLLLLLPLLLLLSRPAAVALRRADMVAQACGRMSTPPGVTTRFSQLGFTRLA